MKHIYKILAILLIAVVGAFVFLAYQIMPTSNNKGINKLDSGVSEEREAKNVFKEGEIFRVLVLGVDKTATKEETEEENGMRSDTIMVISIDKARDKVQIYSVPRDSYVDIHGYGKNKINASFNKYAYKNGGLELTKKTVEDLLDIEIDHYAIVDYKAVSGLVDAVGGMDIEWDHPDYKYTDDWVVPALEIDLKRGTNHLDGTKAVSYLRTRKAYADSDLGRIKAQQEFMTMLADKLKSPMMLIKLPEILDIVDKYVETDLNYGEISYLAQYGLGLDMSTIEKSRVEGYDKRGVKIGSDLVDVFMVYRDKARAAVLRTEEEEAKYKTDTTKEQAKPEGNKNTSEQKAAVVQKKKAPVKKTTVTKKTSTSKDDENNKSAVKKSSKTLKETTVKKSTKTKTSKNN